MMTVNARLALCLTAVAALGIGSFRSQPVQAVEAPDVKADIQKVAEALQKGDSDQAAKLAAEVAKNSEISEVMDLMSVRKAGGKKAWGIGDKPGAVTPDGIEAKLINMSKKPLAKTQMDKEVEPLTEMAYRIAAIGLVAKNKAPAKDEGMKKKADWIQWTEEMAKSAEALGQATKKKDSKEVLNTVKKLNSTCNNCHGVFRD